MGCGGSCARSREADVVAAVVPRAQPNDFFDEYVLGAKLGRGAFAQVRIATQVHDKSHVAVKICDLRSKVASKAEPEKRSRTQLKHACAEAEVWVTAMHHEHVVRMRNIFFDEDFCYFVMEECSSSLFAHMANLPELNERTIGSILAQMLAGISHVHSVKVVHRDVKPDSFLVGGRRGIVKLGDFGSSAKLPKNRKLEGAYGTAPFTCPEMLMKGYYNETADVWSMAVLAYFFLFGEFPYGANATNGKAMKLAVENGEPPSFEPVPTYPAEISKTAVKFVKTLLQREPGERPSAKDALKMPFLVAVSLNQHMNDVELPSLKPMLTAARRTKAFEHHNLSKKTDIDALLNLKHEVRTGSPLPHQILGAKDVFGRKCGPWERFDSGDCQAKDTFGKKCEHRYDSSDWQAVKGWQISKSNNSLPPGRKCESRYDSSDWQSVKAWQVSKSSNSLPPGKKCEPRYESSDWQSVKKMQVSRSNNSLSPKGWQTTRSNNSRLPVKWWESAKSDNSWGNTSSIATTASGNASLPDLSSWNSSFPGSTQSVEPPFSFKKSSPQSHLKNISSQSLRRRFSSKRSSLVFVW